MSRQLLENLQYLCYTLNYLVDVDLQPNDFRLSCEKSAAKLTRILNEFKLSTDPDDLLISLAYILMDLTIQNELLQQKKLTENMIDDFIDHSSKKPPQNSPSNLHLSPSISPITALQRVNAYKQKTKTIDNFSLKREKVRQILLKTCQNGFTAAFAFTIYRNLSKTGFNKTILNHYKAMKAYLQWKQSSEVFFKFVIESRSSGRCKSFIFEEFTSDYKCDLEQLLNEYKKQKFREKYIFL